MPRPQRAITESVLDQAFFWAVRLGSGTVDAKDEADFTEWLSSDPCHQDAWQQIQAIESEFVPLQQQGRVARNALESSAPRVNTPAISLGAALCALFVCFTLWLKSAGSIWPDYDIATGEQLALDLPTGTKVWLNSRSRLDIDTSGRRPVITLYRGEIFVDSSMAGTREKPVVRTEYGAFRPVGTRFNVKAHSDYSKLSVLKGKVLAQGQSDSEPEMIHKGGHWALNAAGGSVRPDNGLSPDAWIDGIIEANDAPLSQVLEALTEQRAGWISYGRDIEGIKVTGVFLLNDTGSALRALEQSLPIEIQYRTKYWVDVKAK